MKNRISLLTTVSAAGDQVSCDLLGEVVILSLRSGAYFGLDPVASRIWELLGEPRLVGTVRDLLLQEYDVEPERCTSELIAVLERFLEWELIELRDA